jgi:hypothetical protein
MYFFEAYIKNIINIILYIYICIYIYIVPKVKLIEETKGGRKEEKKW